MRLLTIFLFTELTRTGVTKAFYFMQLQVSADDIKCVEHLNIIYIYWDRFARLTYWVHWPALNVSSPWNAWLALSYLFPGGVQEYSLMKMEFHVILDEALVVRKECVLTSPKWSVGSYTFSRKLLRLDTFNFIFQSIHYITELKQHWAHSLICLLFWQVGKVPRPSNLFGGGKKASKAWRDLKHTGSFVAYVF